MKCPACGFETPDEQAWCDFCKEPFRKKAPEAQAPAAATPAAPAPPSLLAQTPPISRELLQKLQHQKMAVSGQTLPNVPAEFALLDAGERIPQVPSIYKKVAWLILALIIIVSVILALVSIAKARRKKNQIDQPGVSSTTIVVPISR